MAGRFYAVLGDKSCLLGILTETDENFAVTKLMHPVMPTAEVFFIKLFTKVNIVFLKTQQKFTNKSTDSYPFNKM